MRAASRSAATPAGELFAVARVLLVGVGEAVDLALARLELAEQRLAGEGVSRSPAVRVLVPSEIDRRAAGAVLRRGRR